MSFTPPHGPVPTDVPYQDCVVDNSGLKLRYRLWGEGDKPVLLLQHGMRDHARSWDFVVAGLIDAFTIVVPDLRGHGDSDQVPGGGYEALEFIVDFKLIIDDLEKRGFPAPFHIVGHSLGGNITSHYAGIFPETVAKLVNIEGLGASQSSYENIMSQPAGKRWMTPLESRLKAAARGPRIINKPELAVRRMAQLHTKVPSHIVDHVALHAIRPVDGGFSWKYDPLLGFSLYRPEAPQEYLDLYKAITCPVLMIYGGKSFTTLPDTDGRADVFSDGHLIAYEEAGHWLHHEYLDRFISDLREFLL